MDIHVGTLFLSLSTLYIHKYIFIHLMENKRDHSRSKSDLTYRYAKIFFFLEDADALFLHGNQCSTSRLESSRCLLVAQEINSISFV